ncbi:hypothetical protein Hanom_Chr12g01125771 [Helianthus anomalus]
MGPYLGGATRVVVQPWRCPTHFVRVHICRSEPRKHRLLSNYFDSDEMRRFQRRRFLRVVALLFQSPILTFFLNSQISVF